MDILQNYCRNIYNIYMIYIFRKSDCYNVSGPRLWAQPINLPFQLFPNDSEKDSSKTTCLGQQSKQTTKPVLSPTKLFPTALLLPFCQPGTLFPTETKTKKTEVILDLSNMFGRTSLENEWFFYSSFSQNRRPDKALCLSSIPSFVNELMDGRDGLSSALHFLSIQKLEDWIALAQSQMWNMGS